MSIKQLLYYIAVHILHLSKNRKIYFLLVYFLISLLSTVILNVVFFELPSGDSFLNVILNMDTSEKKKVLCQDLDPSSAYQRATVLSLDNTKSIPVSVPCEKSKERLNSFLETAKEFHRHLNPEVEDRNVLQRSLFQARTFAATEITSAAIEDTFTNTINVSLPDAKTTTTVEKVKAELKAQFAGSAKAIDGMEVHFKGPKK